MPARDPAFRQRLLGALEQPIPPVRRSIFYTLALMGVTLVMIVLPVIYLSFIGLVGFAVTWHVMNNQWLLSFRVGWRGQLLMGSVYVAPVVVGAIAIVFMFKPLLALPAKNPRTRSLTRSAEPLLFEFVDAICEAIGAPEPARIDVDYQLNASAGFRRGLLSMLSTDLVLTIGIPLAAGLTIRQFAGVLAHEFGHFSQGLGMRLSYIVRSINRWFARVVYERDEWDVYLVEATEELDFRFAWILALAQVFVWISRKVLWLLMFVGHVVSCVLLRQMEYDADRYEARLVGPGVFAETTRRFRCLGAAYNLAQQTAFRLFQRGRLADDFAELTLHHAGQLPDQLVKSISRPDEPTSPFSSHPSDRDRISNVRREEDQAVFEFDGRARDLFVHFDATAKNVTWDFYCEVLGPIDRNAMQPVKDLVTEDAVTQDLQMDRRKLSSIPLDD